jgi:hypothetical protein
MLLMQLTLLISLAAATPARAAWQCQQNGKTVYQDAPCDPAKPDTSGKAVAAAAAPASANVQEAKARAAREKAQLAKIEATKAREEASAAKQAQLAARQAQRKQLAQDRRAAQCQRARQQQKWAEQDIGQASLKQIEKARRKAARAQDKAQLLCSQP